MKTIHPFTLALAVAVALCVAAETRAADSVKPRKKNVLFIAVDEK